MDIEKRRTKLLDEMRTVLHEQRKTNDELFVSKRTRSLIEHTLNKIRAHNLVEVSQLRSQDGKPFYPNESSRAAAVEEKLAADKNYKQCLEMADKLDGEIMNARLDLDHLAGEFKVLMLDGQIFVAEITAMKMIEAISEM
jgi:hypothetical protein